MYPRSDLYTSVAGKTKRRFRLLKSDVLQDASLSTTYLIIDALDGCVADLPKLLASIAKQSSAFSHVKWIVSSRNWPDIEEELERADYKTRLSLELNAESVAAAVKTFIQQKVCQLAQEKRYTPEVEDALLQHLTSNANDTFLWVALVCQDLTVGDGPTSRTAQRATRTPKPAPQYEAIGPRTIDIIMRFFRVEF
jgi:hypothetical protein